VTLSFLYGRGLFAPTGPLVRRTFDAAIYTWVATEAGYAVDLWTCAAVPDEGNGYRGQNYSGWCNAEADALWQKTASADLIVDRTQARPVWAAVQRLWTGDAPVIPLYYVPNMVVARSDLKNWRPGPSAYSPETWNCWQWSW
jgi:peptide/nickel transport system substrate-binding protein